MYLYLVIFYKEVWVVVVIKVLCQVEDGDFVFVWFIVLWIELSVVVVFVIVSVEVQCLEMVLEVWDCNGDVGVVWVDIYIFVVNVVIFEVVSGFLGDKCVMIVIVYQCDRDIVFMLIDFYWIDVVLVFIVLVGMDIFLIKDGIGCLMCGFDSSDNGGWFVLYVVDYKDVSQMSFVIMVDVWLVVFVQWYVYCIQGFSILLFINGGDQVVYKQCYCFIGFNWMMMIFFIWFVK